MNRALPALAVSVLLAALAGCGSSSSSGSSSASSTPPPGTTASSSSGAAASKTKANGKTVDVTYQNIAIQPANITVKVGTTIKWTNKDNIAHNVTSESGPQQFSSSNFGQGGTFQITAKSPGVIHYVCSIHPTAMIGTITVTK